MGKLTNVKKLKLYQFKRRFISADILPLYYRIWNEIPEEVVRAACTRRTIWIRTGL